jgi:hypothetical protein
MKVIGQFRATAAVPPKKEAPVPIALEAGCARSGLDGKKKVKFLQCQEANTGHPALIQSLYLLNYPECPSVLSTHYI